MNGKVAGVGHWLMPFHAARVLRLSCADLVQLVSLPEQGVLRALAPSLSTSVSFSTVMSSHERRQARVLPCRGLAVLSSSWKKPRTLLAFVYLSEFAGKQKVVDRDVK